MRAQPFALQEHRSRRSNEWKVGMMLRNEDLGLSLSLSCSSTSTDVAAAAVPAPSPPPTHAHFWSSFFVPSSERRACGMPCLRGIDVNRTPETAAALSEEDDEAGASSPNSTLSSLSGKRRMEDQDAGERACSGGLSDDEDGAGGGARKKLRLSKDQSAILEESFKEHNTLNPKQKVALAKQLNLKPRQVEVWFQNRRARTKLKQTEVDCEFLKRCCESLTEENRRLQKELHELRALKLSAPMYMHMAPPTTLTICPSCERVSSAAGADEHPRRPAVPPGARTPHVLHRPVAVAPTPAPAAPFAGMPLPVHRRPAFLNATPTHRS